MRIIINVNKQTSSLYLGSTSASHIGQPLKIKERGKRKKKRGKQTNTKIGHIKAVMKGEDEAELFLVGYSDRHCVIFMSDQGHEF